MSSQLYWCWLCRVCERAYLKYAQGVVISLESSADPVKEFEATDVKHNTYYVTEASTQNIRVVLDYPRTPPRSRQGLQFEITDAMKNSKAKKLLSSYHDPRLRGVTRFAGALIQ